MRVSGVEHARAPASGVVTGQTRKEPPNECRRNTNDARAHSADDGAMSPVTMRLCACVGSVVVVISR